MQSIGALDLNRAAIHLGDNEVVPIPDFGFDQDAFIDYTDEHCVPGKPGRLMFIETTPESWPAWECHTEGDEVVMVLEGRGTFFQRDGESVTEIPFEAGSTIINPRGVWHTADVDSTMVALYLTPCPGTEHELR